MRKSRILRRSFCDANVCGSQVKAVLLKVIKTLSHVDARLGCSSGQIDGLEGGPWRVLRRKIGSITVGGEAISKIRQIKADICFLGINAIDATNGVTDNDWEVVQVKKAMIESARKVVCLTIAEKLNSHMPFHICPVEDLDMLITELPPEDPLLEPYLQKGIRIL